MWSHRTTTALKSEGQLHVSALWPAVRGRPELPLLRGLGTRSGPAARRSRMGVRRRRAGGRAGGRVGDLASCRPGIDCRFSGGRVADRAVAAVRAGWHRSQRQSIGAWQLGPERADPADHSVRWCAADQHLLHRHLGQRAVVLGGPDVDDRALRPTHRPGPGRRVRRDGGPPVAAGVRHPHQLYRQLGQPARYRIWPAVGNPPTTPPAGASRSLPERSSTTVLPSPPRRSARTTTSGMRPPATSSSSFPAGATTSTASRARTPTSTSRALPAAIRW